MKGLGEIKVLEIYNTAMHMPTQNAEGRARASLTLLAKHGRYWPRLDNSRTV